MSRVSSAISLAEREGRQEMEALRGDLNALLDRAERCAEDCARLTALRDEAKEIARCIRISKDQLAQESPPARIRGVA